MEEKEREEEKRDQERWKRKRERKIRETKRYGRERERGRKREGPNLEEQRLVRYACDVMIAGKWRNTKWRSREELRFECMHL